MFIFIHISIVGIAHKHISIVLNVYLPNSSRPMHFVRQWHHEVKMSPNLNGIPVKISSMTLMTHPRLHSSVAANNVALLSPSVCVILLSYL